jgi:hypothetical protein
MAKANKTYSPDTAWDVIDSTLTEPEIKALRKSAKARRAKSDDLNDTAQHELERQFDQYVAPMSERRMLADELMEEAELWREVSELYKKIASINRKRNKCIEEISIG